MVAGIDLDPDQPGYKNIIMRPHPGGGLTSARAELQSIYGTIRSAWTLNNGDFDWQIIVPANATATVYVPISGDAEVWEGDKLAESANNVSLLSREKNVAAYKVGSGEYHFTTHS